jgi:hypothetical protein
LNPAEIGEGPVMFGLQGEDPLKVLFGLRIFFLFQIHLRKALKDIRNNLNEQSSVVKA